MKRNPLLGQARYYGLARKALGMPYQRVKNRQIAAAVASALGRDCPADKVQRFILVREFCELRGLKRVVKQRAPLPAVATDAFLESPEWRRLRMRVLVKRGARCECCGATPKDGVTVLNVDHVKPRKLFPELALKESNLQVLCHVCNHGKGNWDQTDWRSTDEPDPQVH